MVWLFLGAFTAVYRTIKCIYENLSPVLSTVLRKTSLFPSPLKLRAIYNTHNKYRSTCCILDWLWLLFTYLNIILFWNGNFNLAIVSNFCTGEASSWYNCPFYLYCTSSWRWSITGRNMMHKYKEFAAILLVVLFLSKDIEI